MPNPSTYFRGKFDTLSPIACIVDVTTPTFAGIASTTFQTDGSAVVTWAIATSTKTPVRYEIYVALGSVSAASLFVTANRVAFAPGSLTAWRIFVLRDQVTYFMPGQVYTFGIRAVDSQNFMDSNTVILTATALYPNYGSLAAAVWDQLQAAHTISGSFGKYLDAQVSLAQTSATALTQYNALQTAIGLTQTSATALTQYNALVTDIGLTQTSATALTQYNNLQTAIGLVQTAATALSQYTALISAIGSPQQASVALTQYNNLQTAIGLTQTASTAATQYAAIQTAIAAVQQASVALTQYNALQASIAAISPDNTDILAIKAQTDKMQFDVSNNIKANTEILSDPAVLAQLQAIENLTIAGL